MNAIVPPPLPSPPFGVAKAPPVGQSTSSGREPTKPDIFLGPSLEVVKGEANVSRLHLGQALLRIGRTTHNDLVVKDAAVSRSHAQILFEGDRFLIEDLGSANGTYVNGSRVERAPLADGSRIVVGQTELVYSFTQPEVPAELRMQLIGRCEVLAGLDRDAAAALAGGLALRYFPQQATILRPDAPVESIFFVVSGKVRLVEVNDEGGESLLREVSAGEYFGERALLPGPVARWTAIAGGPTFLLELEGQKLHEAMQSKPELSKTVLSQVRRKLSATDVNALARPDDLGHLVTSTEVRILGEDKRILKAKERVETLAREGKTAVVIGPPGTGKRIFARHYHESSPGREQPYVELSLAELEPGQVEATLFGAEADPRAPHMKGRLGYLETLGSGTLAIVHSELLDAHQQAKLVTYLKLGWFHRVYGQKSVTASTRVVLLLTGDGPEALERFIPELRAALADGAVTLPALAQRLKDIPILAEHFLKAYARRAGKRTEAFSREATERLVTYTWPGNVAELENVIQRAAIISSEATIIPGDLIFVVPAEREIHKLNLLRNDRIRNVLRNPLLLKSFMWVNLVVVAGVAAVTLYGGSRPAGHPLQEFGNNPGMLITWLVWFPLLPITAFLVGRIWCGMCPIIGLGELVGKVKRFNLPVPKILRKLDFWVVVGSFLLLDYMEELTGVADRPWATGMLLVIIIAAAALFCVLFERRAFCRYLCPLRGMLGAYATASMFEVRGNKKVCQTQCGQHTCYKGSVRAPGCPVFCYPASISDNSECMMCTYCLRSCEERGVQVNLRPPLQELWRVSNPALSLSVFSVILVGMMARHQVGNVPWFETFVTSLGLTPLVSYTLEFVGFALLVLVPFLLAATLSAAASQQRVGENMAAFGLGFVPLAFAGHLAHVGHEVLGSGVYELLTYLRKLFDAVLRNVPMAGNTYVMAPVVNFQVVTLLKMMLVFGGVLGAVVALVMIARHTSRARVFARVLPHLLVLLFYAVVYVLIFSATGAVTP